MLYLETPGKIILKFGIIPSITQFVKMLNWNSKLLFESFMLAKIMGNFKFTLSRVRRLPSSGHLELDLRKNFKRKAL